MIFVIPVPLAKTECRPEGFTPCFISKTDHGGPWSGRTQGGRFGVGDFFKGNGFLSVRAVTVAAVAALFGPMGPGRESELPGFFNAFKRANKQRYPRSLPPAHWASRLGVVHRLFS